MKYLLIFLILIYTDILNAQSGELKQFADSITVAHLSKHLTFLASDEMEGRETGMPGGKKAAAFIAKEFEKAGLLKPNNTSYYQQFFFQKDTTMPDLFKIGKEKYEFGKDYIVTKGKSEQNEFTSKQIIFCGYGISDTNYNDYDNKNVTGKVVVIFPGEPKVDGHFIINLKNDFSDWGRNISTKILEANMRGASAILLVNPFNTLAQSTIAAQRSPRLDSIYHGFYKIPVITILPELLGKIFSTTEAENMLKAQSNMLTLNDLNYDSHIRIKLRYAKQNILGSSQNIVGYIEGSKYKNQYVIISAHYDHMGKNGNDIYHGADDNASGVSALLDIANAFKISSQKGLWPKTSIVFIAFSGEEKGLWGSDFYTSYPVFALDSTRIDLNIDMIGRIDDYAPHSKKGTYIYLVGADQISSEIPAIINKERIQYPLVTPAYTYEDLKNDLSLFYRSDHYNFAVKGVPVIFFTSGMHRDYHRPSDTVDKINFDALEKRVRYIFRLACDFANLPTFLKRDLRIPPPM